MENTYGYIRTSRQRIAGETGSDPEWQALWSSIDRLAKGRPLEVKIWRLGAHSGRSRGGAVESPFSCKQDA